jgi:hypothetical protein
MAQAHPGPQEGREGADFSPFPLIGIGVLMRRSTGAPGDVSPGSVPARSTTSPHVRSVSDMEWRTSTTRPLSGQRYS